MTGAREFAAEVYRRNRLLAVLGWLHLAALAVILLVAPFDTRTVTGINPWIKPMKFLVSITVYVWTLAWLLEYVSSYRRAVRLVSWGTAVVFVGEMACIITQAARGVTSHYNVETPFDSAVFSTMGFLIFFNTLLVLLTLALFARPTARLPPAYLWGIRLGLLLFFLGSLEGMAMISNMAHTVGQPDGGPGLPFVNWSTRSGDLRVAHFLSFHALQLLPLAGHALSRRAVVGTRGRQLACVFALALVYLLVTTLLFWQAMRGRPLIDL
ncbi:MAG TPA: hypothetical protein VFX96_07275 [Pyrinomonadaceae bacterium]|nr:hypothetical protein [Pyrinomonadaceae bacterium]